MISFSLFALAQDVAPCPSCSLKIKVIFDEADLPPLPSEDDEPGTSDGTASQASAGPASTLADKLTRAAGTSERPLSELDAPLDDEAEG